jgi:hypothetical protein
MKVETTYDVFEVIKIKELDMKATIERIFISAGCTVYECAYFVNCEKKYCVLYDYEISKVK